MIEGRVRVQGNVRASRTCAMHLTNPPADDERCCGTTSLEKSPSSTCTYANGMKQALDTLTRSVISQPHLHCVTLGMDMNTHI